MTAQNIRRMAASELLKIKFEIFGHCHYMLLATNNCLYYDNIIDLPGMGLHDLPNTYHKKAQL